MQPWFIVSLAALGVAVVLYLAWLLWRWLDYKNGRLGKKKVSAALKKFGIIRNYKILDDLSLAFNGRTAHIDHMLIGFFGILFVSTINDTAEYYGDAKAKEWTMVTEKHGEHHRQRMENLMEKNLHNIDVVREIFSKNGVYNIKMEGVCVFCGSAKKTIIGVTGGQGLMTFRDFKAYLGKVKFEKDNDVDVPALHQLLLKHRA